MASQSVQRHRRMDDARANGAGLVSRESDAFEVAGRRLA